MLKHLLAIQILKVVFHCILTILVITPALTDRTFHCD